MRKDRSGIEEEKEEPPPADPEYVLQDTAGSKTFITSQKHW